MKLIAAVLGLGAILALVGYWYTRGTQRGTPLQEPIQLAARYLQQSCQPDGQFIYRIHLDPEITQKPRYNILRHAGTMYALAMHYQESGDPESRSALLRAAQFLRERCMAPPPEEGELLAIWSRPELNGSGDPLQAKLGGTSLALVALMSLEKIQPGSTPMEELRRLARFLRWMQKPDGSFYSKYIPSQGGRRDQWTSLYYPGEAALGLLMLYERDRAAEWLQSAANALSYLARSRHGKSGVPADHWALIATALLLPHYNSAPTSRQAHVNHAKQICKAMVAEQVQHGDPQLRGAFSSDGRSTPTSTRLEGLLAALTFLPAEESRLRLRIQEAVDRGILFLLRCQVREGEFAGAIPRALLNDDRRAREVRIDYVQHALCAMILYQRSLP